MPVQSDIFIPESVRISRLAEVMAEVQMLRRDIMPCRPALDIGTDIITQYFDVLKRVQVKGQEAEKASGALTFSTRRNENVGKKAYLPGELDAFIFVHTGLEKFFVVPAADIIKSGRHTITFSPRSHTRWANAWWVLKEP